MEEINKRVDKLELKINNLELRIDKLMEEIKQKLLFKNNNLRHFTSISEPFQQPILDMFLDENFEYEKRKELKEILKK